MDASTVINAMVIAGFVVGTGWRGYRRRREYWTAGSWLRFGALMVTAFALLAFALVFSDAVGDAAWTGTAGSTARAFWATLATASLISGSLTATVSLAWFARGDPSRQFALGDRARASMAPQAHRAADAPQDSQTTT